MSRTKLAPPPIEAIAPAPTAPDQNIFRLYTAEKKTQRQIASLYKTSQPSIHRAVVRVREWIARHSPEERGELCGEARMRVALASHQMLLEHQRDEAMREWERSRETIHVKRTRTKTYPEGRKHGGPKITETTVDEFQQRQYGKLAYYKDSRQASHELNVLAAGYVGPGQGSIAVDEAIDPEEREQWNRAVESRDARCAELTQEVERLREELRQMKEAFAALRCSLQGVSKTAHKSPVMNQNSAIQEAARPGDSGIYDDGTPATAPQQKHLESPYQNPFVATGGPPVSFSNVKRTGEPPVATAVPEIEDPSQAAIAARWGDAARIEALQYLFLTQPNLCHGALPHQIHNLPNPKNMTPKQWMERGYPYHVNIDRSE